jgi:glycosyltransferase involved in cell wall biosynthesis
MSLRVLFVNSFYAPEIGGGAELTLQRLANGFVSRNHDVAVFTTGEGELIDNVDGVRVYRYPIDNAFRKLTRDLPGKLQRVAWQLRDRHSRLMAKRFEYVLNEFRPDIVQFHNLPGITKSVWEVPRRFDIRSVQVLHDLNLLCPSSSMFKNGRSCETQCMTCAGARIGYKAASRNVDALVGVSKFVLDRVTEANYFLDAEKRIIYNAQKLPDASQLAIATDIRFGFIGALTQAKGLEWLIDQFDNDYGTLTIAGTGPIDFVSSLKKRAVGKRIEFLGHVPSAEFFPAIDVGVVPSIWNDTLPGVAIEGSAHGRPIIASRLGGLPEIVLDGKTGIIVDPDNPNTLGAAMRSLANDRAMLARMAQAGPAAVKIFTSTDRFMNDYEALYEMLLAIPPKQNNTSGPQALKLFGKS